MLVYEKEATLEAIFEMRTYEEGAAAKQDDTGKRTGCRNGDQD